MSHFQDGVHDVISGRKVLPSGEYSVRLVPAASTGSYTGCLLAIPSTVPDPYGTFVLVCLHSVLCRCWFDEGHPHSGSGGTAF